MSETKPSIASVIHDLRFSGDPTEEIWAHMIEARIQELESELAGCRECRANLDCLSRGAVPVRDDDLVQTWQQAQAALIEFKLWCRTDISRKAFDALHALEAALQPKDTSK